MDSDFEPRWVRIGDKAHLVVRVPKDEDGRHLLWLGLTKAGCSIPYPAWLEATRG